MVTIEDKTLLIAEVFLSGSRPHFLRSQGAQNGVYVRLGSTNRLADQELIAELRRSAEGGAFDEMPMPGLCIDDIDTKAIAQSVPEKPGILLPGMTVKDMKQGISRIRNPVIARFFREMNLIEQWQNSGQESNRFLIPAHLILFYNLKPFNCFNIICLKKAHSMVLIEECKINITVLLKDDL